MLILKACNYALFPLLWKLVPEYALVGLTGCIHNLSFYLLAGVSLLELFLVNCLDRKKFYGVLYILVACQRILNFVMKRILSGFIEVGFFKCFSMQFATYFIVEYVDFQVNTDRLVQQINMRILVFFWSKVR